MHCGGVRLMKCFKFKTFSERWCSNEDGALAGLTLALGTSDGTFLSTKLCSNNRSCQPRSPPWPRWPWPRCLPQCSSWCSPSPTPWSTWPQLNQYQLCYPQRWEYISVSQWCSISQLFWLLWWTICVKDVTTCKEWQPCQEPTSEEGVLEDAVLEHMVSSIS